jgi:hypothetical protein
MENLRLVSDWTITTLQHAGVDQPDTFVEWCNILGMPFILLPFILLQTGILKPGIVFSLLNACGGSLFLLFFIVKWGPGGIVLESFFVLFALWGVVRALNMRKLPKPSPSVPAIA